MSEWKEEWGDEFRESFDYSVRYDLWLMRDGSIIPIKDMETNHLKNTIRYLEKVKSDNELKEHIRFQNMKKELLNR